MPSAIERSSNMYLDSVLYQIVQEVNGIPEQVDTAKSPPQISQLQQLATRHSPAYLRPYHSARHIDPRLSIVDVTRWTSVIVDNDLFASLISAYITYEYPAFPVFQKDIFLEAMVSGDGRFCSPLLVNALLAKACVCDHAPTPDPHQTWASMDFTS